MRYFLFYDKKVTIDKAILFVDFSSRTGYYNIRYPDLCDLLLNFYLSDIWTGVDLFS